MGFVYRACGFEFEHYLAIDKNICVEVGNLHATKPDWNRNLAFRTKPGGLQRHQHRFFVNGFKEAVTELVVHVKEDTDNLLSDFFVLQSMHFHTHLIHVNSFNPWKSA